MKKILVPIDFSKTAEAAINYALHLFEEEPLEINMLHAYKIPISDPMTPMGMAELFVAEQQQKAENSFRKYANDFITNHPKAKERSIDIKTHLAYGMGADLIKSVEDSIKPDLIVMGTNGSTAHRFRIGSVAARTATKVQTPIIMVPAKAEYTLPKKIVFATNYKEDETAVIDELLKQYNPKSTKIYCLHVAKELDITEQLRFVVFKNRFKKELQEKLIELDAVEAEYIQDGISNYIKEKQADMVVLYHTNKNLLKKIFTPSVTRDVVFHSNVPVMVYHQKK